MPLELRHLAYNILRYYYLLTKVRPQAVSHISISIVVLVKVTRVSRQLKMAIGKHGGLWTLISIWARMGPRSSVGGSKGPRGGIMPPISGQATREGICVLTGQIASYSTDPTLTKGAKSVKARYKRAQVE